MNKLTLLDRFITSNDESNLLDLNFESIADSAYAKWLFNTVDQLYLNTNIFPHIDNVFKIFNNKWINTKVIILDEEPDAFKDINDGYSYSSTNSTASPSLEIVFGEIERSYKHRRDIYNLQDWVDQDVLLLNTHLTVQEKSIRSHQELGWSTFLTDCLLSLFRYNLANGLPNPIILAWGNPAKEFANNLLDIAITEGAEDLVEPTCIILEASHPAIQKKNKNVKFIGCNHFSLVNTFLEERGKEPINWLGNSFNKSIYHSIYSTVSDYNYGKYMMDILKEVSINEIKINEVSEIV